MTTESMVEWLSLFYRHVGSRTVILCMDNLGAHLKGVESLPPPPNARYQEHQEQTTVEDIRYLERLERVISYPL
jgi:hypothetical protein